jgi:hypothetical protein
MERSLIRRALKFSPKYMCSTQTQKYYYLGMLCSLISLSLSLSLSSSTHTLYMVVSRLDNEEHNNVGDYLLQLGDTQDWSTLVYSLSPFVK